MLALILNRQLIQAIIYFQLRSFSLQTILEFMANRSS